MGWVRNYTPRFIVQEISVNYHVFLREGGMIPYVMYKDLKEFTSLEEARAFKIDLELEEGIVRE